MRDVIRKKRAAIICAAIVIAGLILYLAAFIYSIAGAVYGEMAAVLILMMLVLIIAEVIAGVVIALCQRINELEGGEEEDAKKY